MNQRPSGNQAAHAVEELFGSDVKTKSDLLVLRICKISGLIAFSSLLLNPIINEVHGVLQQSIFAVAAISALTFIATFCLIGIRSVGRRAGKKSFFTQAWYVLARLTLYVFLPCAILTLILVCWTVLTH